MPSSRNKGLPKISPEGKQPPTKRRRKKSQKSKVVVAGDIEHSPCLRVQQGHGPVSSADQYCLSPAMASIQSPASGQQAGGQVFTPGTMYSPSSGQVYTQLQPPVYGQSFSQPSLQTPPWVQDLMSSMEQIRQDQSAIKIRLEKLDSIDTEVRKLSTKLLSVESSVRDLDTRVADVEKSSQFVSDVQDEQKQTVHDLKQKVRDIERANDELTRTNRKLHDSVLDVQSRTMRENLLFFGLKEEPDENCAETVLKFCETELEMPDASTKVTIDRAHRLGARRFDQTRPRPIVAKFHRFADKEAIKSKGPMLRGKQFGVRDQFPKEIVDRRRELIPVMIRERERGRTCKLVRDKLYINGTEYVHGNID